MNRVMIPHRTPCTALPSGIYYQVKSVWVRNESALIVDRVNPVNPEEMT
jgi:hypothetical protein